MKRSISSALTGHRQVRESEQRAANRHWFRPLSIAAGFWGVLLMLGAAQSAEQDLGTFKAWRAHTFVEGKQRVCSMWSQPTAAVGDYSRRGEIFAFVTHRPAEKTRDKVSFELGYDFQLGEPLKVKIGKRSYTLVTSGSTAWSDAGKISGSMVAAMKGGHKMIVAGLSNRDTKTTDTYSLAGFTAGYRAINKACR